MRPGGDPLLAVTAGLGLGHIPQDRAQVAPGQQDGSAFDPGVDRGGEGGHDPAQADAADAEPVGVDLWLAGEPGQPAPDVADTLPHGQNRAVEVGGQEPLGAVGRGPAFAVVGEFEEQGGDSSARPGGRPGSEKGQSQRPGCGAQPRPGVCPASLGRKNSAGTVLFSARQGWRRAWEADLRRLQSGLRDEWRSSGSRTVRAGCGKVGDRLLARRGGGRRPGRGGRCGGRREGIRAGSR